MESSSSPPWTPGSDWTPASGSEPPWTPSDSRENTPWTPASFDHTDVWTAHEINAGDDFFSDDYFKLDGVTVIKNTEPGYRSPLEVAVIEEWLREIDVVVGDNGPKADDPCFPGSRIGSRRHSKEIDDGAAVSISSRRSRSRSSSREVLPGQDDFYQQIRFEKLEANSLLWLQGLPYEQVWYVLSGEIRVYAQYDQAKEKTMLFEHSPEYVLREKESKTFKRRDYLSRSTPLGDEVAHFGPGARLGDPICENGMLGNSAVSASDQTEVLVLPRYVYEATAAFTCPWRAEMLQRISYLSSIPMFLYGKPQYLVNVVLQMQNVTFDRGRTIASAGDSIDSVVMVVEGEVELRGPLPKFGNEDTELTIKPRLPEVKKELVPFIFAGRGTWIGTIELGDDWHKKGFHSVTAIARSQKVICLQIPLERYMTHAKNPFDNPTVRLRKEKADAERKDRGLTREQVHQLRLKQEGDARIKHPILTELSALHGPRRHLISFSTDKPNINLADLPSREAVFLKTLKFHSDIIDSTAKHTTGCPPQIPYHEINAENMEVETKFQRRLMRTALNHRNTAQGSAAPFLFMRGKKGLEHEKKLEERLKHSTSSIEFQRSTASESISSSSKKNQLKKVNLKSLRTPFIDKQRAESFGSFSDFSSIRQNSLGSFAEDPSIGAETAPISILNSDVLKTSDESWKSSPAVISKLPSKVGNLSEGLESMQRAIKQANSSVKVAEETVGSVLPIVSPIGLPRQSRVNFGHSSRFDKYTEFPYSSVGSSATYQSRSKDDVTQHKAAGKSTVPPCGALKIPKAMLSPVASLLTGNVR